MPWLLCTTGSPTCNSDKSLMSDSTSLTASCLRRRRTLGLAANSSVSVTKSMPSSFQANPVCRLLVAIPKGSVLCTNSAKLSKLGGLTPPVLKKSSRLSRRPSLSANTSTRCVLRVWRFCRRAKGLGEPRSTVRSGRRLTQSQVLAVSVVRRASWAC